MLKIFLNEYMGKFKTKTIFKTGDLVKDRRESFLGAHYLILDGSTFRVHLIKNDNKNVWKFMKLNSIIHISPSENDLELISTNINMELYQLLYG